MSDTVFTIENIIALVKPLAEKYQVQQIYLFGSYARGEADSDSDLDFLEARILNLPGSFHWQRNYGKC